MARADGGALRQRIRTQQRRALALGQDQAGRVGGQGDAVLHVLQQGIVVAVVTHQHGAQGALAVGRDHESAIAVTGFVDVAITHGAFGRGMRIAYGADVDAQCSKVIFKSF